VTNAILTPAQSAVVEACGQLYRQAPEQHLDSAEAGGSSAADEALEEEGEAA
jgi:hypothetical protein